MLGSWQELRVEELAALLASDEVKLTVYKTSRFRVQTTALWFMPEYHPIYFYNTVITSCELPRPVTSKFCVYALVATKHW